MPAVCDPYSPRIGDVIYLAHLRQYFRVTKRGLVPL